MIRAVFVALALLLTASCTKKHPKPGPFGAPEEAASSELAAAVTAEPTIAFRSFAEVVTAGREANTKTALLRVRRVLVRENQLVAVPCDGGPSDLVFFSFTAAQRELVRGLPTGRTGCGTVLLTVTLVDVPGFHGETSDGAAPVLRNDPGMLIEGHAIAFPEVVARPAPPVPAGLDFADVDEIGFAGRSADGKLAELSGRVEKAYDRFRLRPCNSDGSISLEAAPGAAPPKVNTRCAPVRFRVHYSSMALDPHDLRFSGELVN